jgi:hypothetical protein
MVPRILALPLVLALAVSSAWAQAAPDAPPSTRPAPRHATPRPAAGSALDERVRLLAKELDLDAAQQAGVKRILEEQRAQVVRVWSDTSVPAAQRVNATQAISNRTADQIRALLNDEQKKKFSAPRQPRDPSEVTPGTSVEDWMNAAHVQ